MKIGIDLVTINRIIGHEDQFFNKILSEEEKLEYLSRSDKLNYLAGRYAGKEAFLKANGLGLFEIPLNAISITNDIAGAPHIKYDNKEEYSISISHDGDYAIAIVVRNI